MSEPSHLPDRIRSFVAVDLDAVVRDRLGILQDELGQYGGDLRWVRPQGIHITLKFLGALGFTQLQQVHGAIAAHVSEIGGSTLRVHGIGGFPTLHRPRVLWVGLQDDGTLRRVFEHVEAALAPLHLDRNAADNQEHRKFRPHATIARVNSWRGWRRLEEALVAHRDDDFGNSELRSVIIYRSTLQRGGSVYNPLWTISLTENRGTP